jgi:dihydroorotate dehydrogenase electron transfer subunit
LYQKQTFIKSNQEVMPGIYQLVLESPEIASNASPGQFVMFSCDNRPGRLLRRPLSIHRVQENAVSFLFAVMGKGTEWLAQRQPGERVSWLGPLGNGFQIQAESHNLLLVAGGMGIPPLCFLAAQGVKKGCSIRLLIGAKSTYQICPEELIPSGVAVFTATEDGSSGEKGLVTNLLPEHLQWADQVFICGPLPMYRTLVKETHLLKKPAQVSLEVRMGCGLGFCYACTIKTKGGLKQVCKDGPVFDIRDILWDDLK